MIWFCFWHITPTFPVFTGENIIVSAALSHWACPAPKFQTFCWSVVKTICIMSGNLTPHQKAHCTLVTKNNPRSLRVRKDNMESPLLVPATQCEDCVGRLLLVLLMIIITAFSLYFIMFQILKLGLSTLSATWDNSKQQSELTANDSLRGGEQSVKVKHRAQTGSSKTLLSEFATSSSFLILLTPILKMAKHLREALSLWWW